jgi:hypothetical protein
MSSFCGIHSWIYPIGVATTATPAHAGAQRDRRFYPVSYKAIGVPFRSAGRSCVATQNGIGSWKKGFAQFGVAGPEFAFPDVVKAIVDYRRKRLARKKISGDSQRQ